MIRPVLSDMTSAALGVGRVADTVRLLRYENVSTRVGYS